MTRPDSERPKTGKLNNQNITDIGTSIAEIQQNAQRLGLTWTLRPGTVQTVPTSVVMDGDDALAVLTVTSLIGPCAVGERVMIMSVPPSNNYIVGSLTGDLHARTVATKLEDETINNVSALQPDEHMFALVAPHSRYAVDVHASYVAAVAAGLKVDFDLPSGATLGPMTFISGGTGSAIQHGVTVAGVGSITGIAGSGGPLGLDMHGVLTTTGDGGRITFRWAQNAANLSDAVMQAGSSLQVQRSL